MYLRRKDQTFAQWAANATIDELREQLDLEREINALLRHEIDVVSRELLRARIELAPSPSATVN